MTLPAWLQADWQRWQTMRLSGRLPHALLIGGSEGIGKSLLAEKMVAALLCQQPDQGGACGACKACLLNQASSHPDYKTVMPLDAGKAIVVDSIRSLQSWLTATAQQGGNKVIMLTPAHDLNINAANALLKHLEEPVNNTFFILIHHWPKPILSTIRSRCQTFSVSSPDVDIALTWLLEQNRINGNDDQLHEQAAIALRMAQGSPLLAKQYMDDDNVAWRQQVLTDLTAILRHKMHTSQVAENWVKQPVLPILEWWLQWVQDLIKLMQTGSAAHVTNQDIIKLLNAIAKRANMQVVFSFYDELLENINSLHQRRNTNQQLLLEKLLNDWYQLV